VRAQDEVNRILVALSLLRLGTDTLIARRIAELTDGLTRWEVDLADLARTVVDPLGPEWQERYRLAEERAVFLLGLASQRGVRVVSALDPDYPGPLRRIIDPPLALWCLGDVAAASGPSVAVVGSRYPTPAGLLVARQLGRELAEEGLTVVSGLARGIDGAAHRGALEAAGAGRTTAVLGNGPDVAYPREHRELLAAIKETGAVLSEFPPGSRPESRHFPLRNRVISGLSLAVVVVEASQKSGSLITARQALEQGRDVLAVPGSVVSGASEGCHALIKDGARLVETVDDILEELGRPRRTGDRAASNGKPLPVRYLDRLLRVAEPLSVDELAVRSGRPAAQCLADLAVLEVAGYVGRMPGGGFVKLDGPATYIGRRPPAGGKDQAS
jgi:DNA processing protein